MNNLSIRMRGHAVVLAIASVFAFIAGCLRPASGAPLYRVEALAPSERGDGEARAINVAGDVAGRFDGSAFVWHAGAMTRIPAQRSFSLGDAFSSIATAIARDGTAAGHDGEYIPCSMSGLELASAVRFAHGEMSFVDRSRDGECSFEVDGMNDFGTLVGESGYRGFVRFANGREIVVRPLSTRPEYNGTRATAIDNEGHVVGGTTINVPPIGRPYASNDEAYVIHAFFLTLDGDAQRMRDLGAIPGFRNTYATALNEDGVVVGYSGTTSGAKWTRVSGPSHAWVWQRGRMTDLGAGIIGDTFAYGINDASVIVGCAGKNAVRWMNKRMEDINALIDRRSGWHVKCARAINRSGMIAAIATHGGKSLPVRLVPIHHERDPAI